MLKWLQNTFHSHIFQSKHDKPVCISFIMKTDTLKNFSFENVWFVGATLSYANITSFGLFIKCLKKDKTTYIMQQSKF